MKRFLLFLLAYLFENKISHLADEPSAKFHLLVISSGRSVMFKQARNSRHWWDGLLACTQPLVKRQHGCAEGLGTSEPCHRPAF